MSIPIKNNVVLCGILMLLQVCWFTRGQICKTDHIGVHICSKRLHTIFQNREDIQAYCGRPISGNSTALLTNGQNVLNGEAPWMISIVHSRRHQCGGVIIGELDQGQQVGTPTLPTAISLKSRGLRRATLVFKSVFT
jgi:hypothetical protein